MDTHSKEHTLRESWAALAHSISQSEDSILIEFTGESYSQYNKNKIASFSEAKLESRNEKIRLETARENHFREMLGNKYFLFPGQLTPREVNIVEEISRRGFILDNNISIKAFGEYYEACVDYWSLALKDILEKRGVNIKLVLIPELSLDSWLDKDLELGREIFGRKIPKPRM